MLIAYQWANGMALPEYITTVTHSFSYRISLSEASLARINFWHVSPEVTEMSELAC